MKRALAIALLGACAAAPPEPAAPAPAPRLTALDGTRVAWQALIGERRETLLVFLTPWCAVCKREQPAVERFARNHAAGCRTVYVINGTDLDGARSLVKSRGIGVESYLDADGALARRLAVRGTPTLLLFAGRTKPAGRYRRIERVPPPNLVPVEDEGRELGTSYHVLVLASDVERARADLAAARELCRTWEARFSEWRADSEISRVNAEAPAGPAPLSDELRRLLEGASHVSRVTGGAFDVTWRPLGEMWDAAERAQRPPDPAEVARALESVGERHLRIDERGLSFDHPRTRLGIAGVAKGWIIDALFLELRRRGYAHVVVNIGGDLRTAGRDAAGALRRFRIADPGRPERTAATLRVGDTAVATSGNTFRYREIGGRRYGHILDPRTGHPPGFDGSVTVLAPDAAMADALATALFVMGPDEGLAFARRTAGVEAVYATGNGVRATIATH